MPARGAVDGALQRPADQPGRAVHRLSRLHPIRQPARFRHARLCALRRRRRRVRARPLAGLWRADRLEPQDRLAAWRAGQHAPHAADERGGAGTEPLPLRRQLRPRDLMGLPAPRVVARMEPARRTNRHRILHALRLATGRLRQPDGPTTGRVLRPAGIQLFRRVRPGRHHTARQWTAARQAVCRASRPTQSARPPRPCAPPPW